MAVQYGRNHLVLAALEDPTRTKETMLSASVFFNGTVIINPGHQVIEVNAKTGDRQMHEKQKVTGLKAPTATINCELCEENIALALGMFFSDTSAPYTIASSDAGNTYTIYSYDTGNSTYDYIYGARCESMTISGEQGAALQLVLTFRGIDTEFDIADTGDNALTNVPTDFNLTPMLFQLAQADVFDAGDYTSTLLHSFSLELTNTFQDDNLSFFNSQTRQQDYVCKVGGVFNFTTIQNTTTNTKVHSQLIETSVNNNLKLVLSTGNYYIFTMYGNYENYERPIDGECQLLLPVSMNLLYSDTSTASAIAVSYTTV